MGVRGLTSFVAKNNLGKRNVWNVKWPIDQQLLQSSSEKTPLVIDGSALFYHLFFQSGDWVYGGNFLKFTTYLRAYLTILRAIGFDLYVLIDGYMPNEKMPTCLSREAEKIRRIIKVQRSILASDGAYRSLDGFMSSLAYYAAIEVLKEEGVWFRVCFKEADCLIASLANQKKGFVMSKDSDFFIFNTAGYFPLYDLEIPKELLNLFWGTDPTFTGEFTIQGMMYSSRDIAAHFKIPTDYLAFFGGLAGNDFEEIGAIVDKKYKESHAGNMTPHDRIIFVAEVMGPLTEKYEKPKDSISDLTLAFTEKEELREKIAQCLEVNLRHYSILEFSDFDLEANMPFGENNWTTEQKKWLALFSNGDLSMDFIDTIIDQRFMCYTRLSSLDVQSPWLTTRQIRCFIYQVLSQIFPQSLTEYEGESGVVEYGRRGYNFKPDFVPVVAKQFSEEDISKTLELLHYSPRFKETVPTQYLSIVLALRLFVKSAAVSKTNLAPKLSDFEIKALILTILLCQKASLVLKTNFKKAKQPAPISPRTLQRGSQWQNAYEHVFMLFQFLHQLVPNMKSEFVISTISNIYHGQLFHHLVDRLRGGADALSIIKEVDETVLPLYEVFWNETLMNFEQDIEVTFKTKEKKKKEKKETKEQSVPLNTKNLYDLLDSVGL